ncbi:MAG: ParB/RepB/Spo0J family partition protein [Pseudomonadota bacterium]|nr:ParB/RepB/Spo0J family partition protein [Pseudomonadota bacterium]
MAKFKGLGRGLDALLSGSDETAGGESLRSVPIERIGAGKFQPRTHMDEASLAELAASIKAQGVMQPILVRPVDGGRFEIIAGERRWRAAQRAGLKEVPALVRNVPDQAALALALIENIQRENLNPLEEAQGIARLISEFRLTHDAAAAAVGRSRSAVSNLLRLTQLPKQVQGYLLAGKLDMGHARALLGLSGAQQVTAAAKVVAEQLTVRDTERLVRGMLAPTARRKARAGTSRRDADVVRLEEELAETLGARVRIDASTKGAGRVVIAYSSLEQLDGILVRLRRK